VETVVIDADIGMALVCPLPYSRACRDRMEEWLRQGANLVVPALWDDAQYLARLDLARLVEYALRYDVGALIKRLGWSLEQMGVADEVVAPLRDYPVKAWYRLDPRGEGDGEYNPRWHIVENLRRDPHA